MRLQGPPRVQPHPLTQDPPTGHFFPTTKWKFLAQAELWAVLWDEDSWSGLSPAECPRGRMHQGRRLRLGRKQLALSGLGTLPLTVITAALRHPWHTTQYPKQQGSGAAEVCS